jgi:putative ABC transport system permease protein
VSIALFGVDEGSFLGESLEGRQAPEGAPGLILSDELRSRGLDVGDELTIAGSEAKLPVLGFTHVGSYGHVDIAVTQLATWQQLFYGDNAHGRFSAVALRVDDAVSDSTLASASKASDTEVLTKKEAYAGSPGYSGETQTMTMIRGFLLVISALIVGAFFTVWTIQRRRQIALLKALGASTGYVVRDALGQMAIVLVAATAIGSTVAIALGAAISGTAVPFRLEAGPVLAAVSLLVVIGLLGCLAAVRRITSVDPAGALRQVD